MEPTEIYVLLEEQSWPAGDENVLVPQVVGVTMSEAEAQAWVGNQPLGYSLEGDREYRRLTRIEGTQTWGA